MNRMPDGTPVWMIRDAFTSASKNDPALFADLEKRWGPMKAFMRDYPANKPGPGGTIGDPAVAQYGRELQYDDPVSWIDEEVQSPIFENLNSDRTTAPSEYDKPDDPWQLPEFGEEDLLDMRMGEQAPSKRDFSIPEDDLVPRRSRKGLALDEGPQFDSPLEDPFHPAATPPLPGRSIPEETIDDYEAPPVPGSVDAFTDQLKTTAAGHVPQPWTPTPDAGDDPFEPDLGGFDGDDTPADADFFDDMDDIEDLEGRPGSPLTPPTPVIPSGIPDEPRDDVGAPGTLSDGGLVGHPKGPVDPWVPPEEEGRKAVNRSERISKLLDQLERSRRTQQFDMDPYDIEAARIASTSGYGMDDLAAGSLDNDLISIRNTNPELFARGKELGPVTSLDLGFMGNKGIENFGGSVASFANAPNIPTGVKRPDAASGWAPKVLPAHVMSLLNQSKTPEAARAKLHSARERIKESINPASGSSYGRWMRGNQFGFFDNM